MPIYLQMIVAQGTTMLDQDGAILSFKKIRVGYIYRSSLGASDYTGNPAENESIFTRPLVLVRLAQFLQRLQVLHTTLAKINS